MTAQGERRASGRETGEEIAHEHVAQHDTPATVRDPEAETRQFDFSAVSRMRTEWRGPDADRLRGVERNIETVLYRKFFSLYKLREYLWSHIRVPLAKADGEIKVDRFGLTRWQKHPEGHPQEGMFIEDWSLMTDTLRTEILDRLVNYLFEWERAAEHLRAEALYARAEYESLYAEGFESLPVQTATRPTVDDREARAKRVAAEDRLFALYMTSLSRQADALVRSATRLEQRMKDLLPSR